MIWTIITIIIMRAVVQWLHSLVVSEMVLSPECFAADIARVWPFIRVRSHVYEEVVWLAELAVAVCADVPFLGFAARCGAAESGRAGARGCRGDSHLPLHVPGQSHSAYVALHLTGRATVTATGGERATRVRPEPCPDRVHVQRRETESSGEFQRLSGGHHLSSNNHVS